MAKKKKVAVVEEEAAVTVNVVEDVKGVLAAAKIQNKDLKSALAIPAERPSQNDRQARPSSEIFEAMKK
jgi:hypothetical protein